jgi:chaperone modulatory protein CbpM
MENENLISVEQFCAHYHIEFSFIQSLEELGLLQITTIEETSFLQKEHIKDLEKMIRMHYDLDINTEGIEAIFHILQRVDHLHQELNALKTRLRFYEGEERH